MEKIRAVIVGFGDRGAIYANFANEEPNVMEVVAVVDVSTDRLALAKKRHNLSDDRLFTDLDEFIASGIKADLIVNATMDQQHYDVLKKILPLAKFVLTEKPIVNSKDKLLELKEIADKHETQVFVGHVLRYSPFYLAIKKVIESGEIGDIISLELAEHVQGAHYSGSYARGRWNSEKECGSTFLLAKSCHDTDLACWLNNSTRPTKVSSFGGRYFYTRKNAPEGSTEYCFNCPLERKCIYSAVKMYGEHDFSPEVTHPLYHKEVITPEDRMEFVKSNSFGRCIWKIDEGDIVDRQVLNIEYENGSVCSFALIGGTSLPNRTIFVTGTKGEIEGKMEEGKFTVRVMELAGAGAISKDYDVNSQIFQGPHMRGHNGGDYALMSQLTSYINGDRSSISLTKIEDSIYGHLIVYAADESRLSGHIVDIEKL